MKLVQEAIPTNDLRRFVESMWICEGNGRINLIPDGTFQIISSRSPIRVESLEINHLPPGTYLLPMSTCSYKVSTNGRLLGARIKAFAFSNRTHKHWKKVGKSEIPFVDLCFVPGRNHPQGSLLQFQSFLFDMLHCHQGIEESTREKVNYILERKGDVRINDMVQHFCESRQRLWREFKTAMGVTPKCLASIWRFNNLVLLVSRNDSSLTVSAIEAGYYDQAHAIRSFRKYAGIVPGNWARSLSEQSAFPVQCIEARFSNKYDPI